MLIFQDCNHEQLEKKTSQHLQTAVLLFLLSLLRWGRLCVGFDKPFPSLPPFYLGSLRNLGTYLIPVSAQESCQGRCELKTPVLPMACRALALMKIFLMGPFKKCRAGAVMRSPAADESWGTAAPSCRDARGQREGGLAQLPSLEEKAPLSLASYQLALPSQPPCWKGLFNL